VAVGLRIARTIFRVVTEPTPDQAQSTCGVPIGRRTATIAVNIPGPTKLAGVQINLDYPQFQVSLPARGAAAKPVSLLQSPLDASADLFLTNDLDTELVALIAEAQDAFIDDGDLLEVTLDACIRKDFNVCLRQQNVYGCCPSGLLVPDPLRVPPVANACQDAVRVWTGFDPLTPPLGLYEEVALGGCCPNDDGCAAQAAVTGCSVSDPVDADGNPVAGVTCTVTVAGN
jgi:hypothetical protein